MGSIRKNFTYQFVYQLLVILTPLVTTPYLARVLGPDQVGVFAYTNSVAQYFVMFAVLGMSSYGVRLVSSCGDNRARRTNAFWQAYYAKLISGGLSLTVFVIYVMSDPKGGMFINGLWSMYVISAIADVSWLLFGCQEFRIPTIRSIIVNIVSLIIIFGFVKQPSDLWIYVVAIAGTFLLNQLIMWPFVSRYVGFAPPVLREVFANLRGSLRLFIPVIAISLYTYFAKVMLGSLSTMEQSGFYDYSQKLSMVPLSLISALGTVMLPKMTAELSAGEVERAKGHLDTAIWIMLVMAFGTASGVAAIAPEFVPVYLGAGYEECVPLMMLLSVVIPVATITNVLGRQWLLPSFRDNHYTGSIVAGAAVSVVLNFLLIPSWGAFGAAIASVSAEVMVLVVQMAYVRRELPLGKYILDAIPYVVFAALEFAAVRAVAAILEVHFGTTILGLVAELIVGGFAYALLALGYIMWRKEKRIANVLGSATPRFLQR